MPQTTMDGTEQVLFESTELGEYSGYVFMNNMQAGDTIVLRAYIKNVEDEVYYLRDAKTFNDVQSVPAVGIAPTVGKVGIKITGEQTAGTYRTLDHMWFKR